MMVHVTTWELLGARHLVTTDDTCGIPSSDLFLCGVREGLQQPSEPSVLQVLRDPLLEVGIRHIQVSHDVEGQPIVGTNNQKENHVHKELEKISNQLEIKHVRSLREHEHAWLVRAEIATPSHETARAPCCPSVPHAACP